MTTKSSNVTFENVAKDADHYRQAWRSHIQELAGALAWDDYARWKAVEKELLEMLEVRISNVYKGIN